MLPLQVAWYLPLLIPSKKLVLTTQKLTCKTMSSPFEVIAWECGGYASTNEDATHRDCILYQTPGPLCHSGWCYSSRIGEYNESGLLQAGARCNVGNSCACRCWGGAYCRQWATCCGRECGHSPRAGSPIGVKLCKRCHVSARRRMRRQHSGSKAVAA